MACGPISFLRPHIRATCCIYVEFDKQALVWHVQDRKSKFIALPKIYDGQCLPGIGQSGAGVFYYFHIIETGECW